MLKITTNRNQNGFETHEIERLSSSSINLAREATDAWLTKYIGGASFPTNFAMWQGKAVELGVDLGIYSKKELDECITEALKYYSKNTSMLIGASENYAKAEPIIKKMVQNGIQQLRTIGTPLKPNLGEHQHKVEIPIRFEEGEIGKINCIGYLDYWFPEQNTIVDLKTTAKAPNKFSLSHGIQASIYKKAMEKKVNKPVRVLFLYVLTRIKDPFVWLELEEHEVQKYLKSAKRTVRQLENLLSVSSEIDDLLNITMHNPDSFYWNNADDIKAKFYP